MSSRGVLQPFANRFEQQYTDFFANEGVDELGVRPNPCTQGHVGRFRKVLNEVRGPRMPHMYSLNPYQGCEHGCAYCYARDSHNYWGWNAGIDFETKIVVKRQAPALFQKEITKKGWKRLPVMLSGNTDCYQPMERKERITRRILELCLRYGVPAGIVTKNALVLRDMDILVPMARKQLIHVYLSLTTLRESLRRIMEPRTATAQKRLQVLKVLTDAGVPTGVMLSPIIPGLNDEEMPALLEAAAHHGAFTAHRSTLYLQGSVFLVFRTWLKTHFASRFDSIWKKICQWYNLDISVDKIPRGEQERSIFARTHVQLFRVLKARYFGDKTMPSLCFDYFDSSPQQTLW